MLAGCALVATDGALPGPLGAAAVLVRPDDVPALDVAVRRLLDDPQWRAELVARARIQADGWPTESDTVASVETVYADLLRRHG